jgi:hypothetical protein
MNRLQIFANVTELTNSAPNNSEKYWELKNYLYINVKPMKAASKKLNSSLRSVLK